jgi:hypothetical protein
MNKEPKIVIHRDWENDMWQEYWVDGVIMDSGHSFHETPDFLKKLMEEGPVKIVKEIWWYDEDTCESHKVEDED